MNLTIDASAQARIQQTQAEEQNPNLKLRIFVSYKTAESVRFGFVFDENATNDDTVVDSVIVENSAALLMNNATLTHDGRTYIVNLA